MPHYCIGIDFGTLSARALLVVARTGRELSSGGCDYPHGVMESALPSGEKLGFGWALQDPADYLFALEKSVALALRDAPGCAGDVIGIGIGAAACTLLAVPLLAFAQQVLAHAAGPDQVARVEHLERCGHLLAVEIAFVPHPGF